MKRTNAQLLNCRSQLEAALVDSDEIRGRSAFDKIVKAGPVVKDAIWNHGKANGFRAMILEVVMINP